MRRPISINSAAASGASARGSEVGLKATTPIIIVKPMRITKWADLQMGGAPVGAAFSDIIHTRRVDFRRCVTTNNGEPVHYLERRVQAISLIVPASATKNETQPASSATCYRCAHFRPCTEAALVQALDNRR